MPIRWGSTKNMITRFLLLEGPIRVLTEKPQQIPAFDDKQQNHFKKLKLSELEWLVLRIIDRNLSKFSDATMVLSGRSYHTLSLSSVILKSKLFDQINRKRTVLFAFLFYFFVSLP